MADPEVNLHGELAELAEAKARSEGVSLPELIERWLREYLAGERE